MYIGESYRSRHEEFTAKDIQDWYLAEPEFFKESAAKVVSPELSKYRNNVFRLLIFLIHPATKIKCLCIAQVLSSSDQGFQTGMEKSDDDHDDTNSVEALPTSSMIHPPNPTSFVVEQPGGTLADSQSFQEVIPREAEWVRHSSCVLGQSMQPQIDYAVRNPNSKPLKVYRLKGSVPLKSSQTETGIRRELLNVVRTCYHRYQELKEQVQRNGSGGDPLYQDGTECRINKAETALIALRHELAEMDRVWKESQSH